MKKIVFLLILLAGCSSEISLDPDMSEKAQALFFSLQIVESFFDGDCKKSYDNMIDPILYGHNELPKNSDLKKTWCDSIRSMKGISFEEYLSNFEAVVYNKTEYDELFPLQISSSFTSKDYLFRGDVLKPGKEIEVYDEFLVFMVRKTDEGWRISGLGR